MTTEQAIKAMAMGYTVADREGDFWRMRKGDIEMRAQHDADTDWFKAADPHKSLAPWRVVSE